MDNWITVITFTQSHEAHIASGVLESEGITTNLKDELTAQTTLYANAIGGIKVQIKESQWERGIAILKKGGFISSGSTQNLRKIEFVQQTIDTNKNICPFCASSNIGRNKEVSLLTIFVFSILAIFLPIFKRTYLCFDCNKEWKFTPK